MRITVFVKIFGIVQGVFYRKSTYDKATELGLKGWVRNCEDGSVEAVFEGEESTVEQILDWCHEGPERARVSGVEVSPMNTDDELVDFTIL